MRRCGKSPLAACGGVSEVGFVGLEWRKIYEGFETLGEVVMVG